MNIEKEFKTSVAAESLTGIKHKLNEDRYRMLSKKAPLVKELDRGELFGVFDGIGQCPQGHGGRPGDGRYSYRIL